MLHRTYSISKSKHSNQSITFSAFWIIVTTTILTAATQPNLAAPNGVASIVLALFFSEAYANCRPKDRFSKNNNLRHIT
jgi:uncharacterized membrane protein